MPTMYSESTIFSSSRRGACDSQSRSTCTRADALARELPRVLGEAPRALRAHGLAAHEAEQRFVLAAALRLAGDEALAFRAS